MDSQTDLQNPNQDTHFQIQNSQKSKKYHNVGRLAAITIALCLGPFYQGFSFAYLSSVAPSTLQTYFKINPLNINVTTGNLIGVLPIGGIFGALLAPLLMKFFSRKNFLLIIDAIALLLAGIIQINDLIVLYICRFFIGFLCGSYMAITPIYINQIVPVQIQGSFGALTQLHIVIGIVLCYLLGVIFSITNADAEFTWRFLFSFTGITVFIQACLLIFGFIPQSPVSLAEKGDIEETKRVLLMFNTPDVLDKVLSETLSKVVKVQKGQKQKSSIQERSEIKQDLLNKSIIQKQKQQNYQIPIIPKAMFLGFQLPFMQVMSGINIIITQIGIIVAQYDSGMALYASLIANSVQIIGSLGCVFALSYFGRRTLILFGNFALGILDIIIGIFFLILYLFNWKPAIYIALFIIIIYMLLFGLTLGPVVWLYVPEIIPARFVPLATSMNWIGCSITIILTPIIMNAAGSSYPVFFMYGGITIIFAIINYTLVVETKGLSLVQISKKMIKQN